MEKLVDLKPIADVANNLIDKLSSAVGWVATHDTPHRTAVNTYIEGIQNSNYDPLVKAALISNAKKTIKEYCNQQNIVDIAISSMKPSARPGDIDPDWLAQFMDKARLVSDQDFQILWGNILSEECNVPGSIPRVLLHAVEQMDKLMAEAFLSLASVSIQIHVKDEILHAPIITDHELQGIYKQINISYDDLFNLQSIGLINIDFGAFSGNYGISSTASPLEIHYHDQTYRFPCDITNVPIGHVIYTKAGEALCQSVSPKKIDDFLESTCIPFWDKKIAEFNNQPNSK